jgi:drug/metabolite transporter (DMT)-like permease
MISVWPFILSLAAALLYVAAALSLKRSAEAGAGLWHSSFVSNVVAAIAFQCLLPFGGRWQPIETWHQPLLVAVLYIAGQVLALWSLQRGDVSIATPVLGIKILLVALFTTIIARQTVSWQLWVAAGLSTAGIICLNHSGAHKTRHGVAVTIGTAAGAAVAFAVFDVLVQKWSPAWGIGRFLPATIGLVGLLSIPMVLKFPSPYRALSRPAKRWLAGGSVLLAAQSLLFVSSLGQFGEATASNVVYSSRGAWSVAAVALLGRWLQSSETNLGRSILWWRFSGALLMFAAILLLLA